MAEFAVEAAVSVAGAGAVLVEAAVLEAPKEKAGDAEDVFAALGVSTGAGAAGVLGVAGTV